jgi:ADP-ribose pyrophosphatase
VNEPRPPSPNATAAPRSDPERAQFPKVASRTIYDGHILTLSIDTFSAPDGSVFEREIVSHLDAVAVVPVTDDGHVVLVRQYRVAIDEHLLEIPAGLLDVEGEPPELGARRELREEAGFEAAELTYLCTMVNSPGFCTERVSIYVATGLSHVGTDRQGHEEQHMSLEHVRIADIPTLIETGAVTDSKTVIGLLMVAGR